MGVQLAARQNREAVARFIHGFAAWRLWATLTFAHEVGEAIARQDLRRWLRAWAVRSGGHHFYAVAEDLQRRGVPHFHLLISGDMEEHAGTGPASSLELQRADLSWRSASAHTGHAHVERFDPEQGAAWYMAGHAAWDINVACPRRPVCRRSGCVRAPGPW